MRHLWAPWRDKYIINADTKKCIFCLKNFKEKDANRYIISKSEQAFSMLNIYPYNTGHMMVAPYKHVNRLGKLTEAELFDLISLVRKTEALLEKAFKPHGFNVGLNIGRASGAGFDAHIHFHIVPRWHGDTNFMPIFAETKVMPQSLDAVYKKLKRSGKV